MSYRLLGPTGLMVHPLCLGTMNFGDEVWGCDEKTSLRILESYAERGGNFIDTANRYSAGRSEEIVGKFLRGRRDEMVVATKCFFPEGKGPNRMGLTRKNIFDQVENSLRRLGTDYIDLYQVHVWDPLTPIDETLSALTDLVHQGKVRYLGNCNFTAWQTVLAAERAESEGLESFVSTQVQYNLLCREIEAEVIPACEPYEMGILAWSPLAFGLLSGKYSRDGGPEGARMSAPPDDSVMAPWRERIWTDRNFHIVEAVKTAADRLEMPPAALSTSWVLQQESITSAIIGPRSVEQLDTYWEAVDRPAPIDVLEELDELSAPDEGCIAFMQRSITDQRMEELE